MNSIEAKILMLVHCIGDKLPAMTIMARGLINSAALQPMKDKGLIKAQELNGNVWFILTPKGTEIMHAIHGVFNVINS